jgi:arylsulfatase A-like enzyme
MTTMPHIRPSSAAFGQPHHRSSPGHLEIRAARPCFSLLAAAAWILACPTALASEAGSGVPARPNIVLILADDMGYGDPGCYNPAGKIPTPHLDALAAQGMRFTDAHSPAAVCSPTRYGLLTGRYCWRVLKQGVLGGYGRPLIETTRPTLASILKQQGYTTACIGKWHIGATFHAKDGRPTTRETDIDFTAPIRNGPCALGFDYAYWHAGCGTAAPPYGFIENEHFVPPSFSYQKMEPYSGNGMTQEGWVTANADPILTAKACGFLRRSAAGAKPFFLYLAPNAPHEPCTAEALPEFARGKSAAGHRGDMVWLFDWTVGRVLETLDSTGQADNTLVIVTSDNGALPGDFARDENGRRFSRAGRNWVFEDFGHKSCGPFRGYKAHIWEGGHRVPLIVRWPGTVKPSSVADETICLTDLVATCAAITGADLPAAAGEDSVNMLPALRGRNPADRPLREAIVHHSSDGVFAIRRGKWKLIVDTGGSGGWPPPRGGRPVPGSPGQLYDLQADPGEQTNRWGERQDVVDQLTTLLKRYRQEGRSVVAGKR